MIPVIWSQPTRSPRERLPRRLAAKSLKFPASSPHQASRHAVTFTLRSSARYIGRSKGVGGWISAPTLLAALGQSLATESALASPFGPASGSGVPHAFIPSAQQTLYHAACGLELGDVPARLLTVIPLSTIQSRRLPTHPCPLHVKGYT
jgi:hypothetical protein